MTKFRKTDSTLFIDYRGYLITTDDSPFGFAGISHRGVPIETVQSSDDPVKYAKSVIDSYLNAR